MIPIVWVVRRLAAFARRRVAERQAIVDLIGERFRRAGTEGGNPWVILIALYRQRMGPR